MADENYSALEKSTMRKVFWRIIPYCFGLYIISYLDRANIGYAALQMNRELALTSEAFGFAAGIFFIGYFLFEVPSNVALNRYGATLLGTRSEEHTSELQSLRHLVCRLLLEKKKHK